MTAEYRDRWIECTPEHLVIRGYCFPWGTKRIPYDRIRAVRQVKLGLARGRARLWGPRTRVLGRASSFAARRSGEGSCSTSGAPCGR